MARGWAIANAAAVAMAAMAFVVPAMAHPCRAPAPAEGQTVSGPVMHVPDGRTLCIGLGPTPESWVPLRISPSVAALPVDRDRLMAAAFSRSLRCTVLPSAGPVRTAACTLAGRPLEAILAEPATVTAA